MHWNLHRPGMAARHVPHDEIKIGVSLVQIDLLLQKKDQRQRPKISSASAHLFVQRRSNTLGRWTD